MWLSAPRTLAIAILLAIAGCGGGQPRLINPGEDASFGLAIYELPADRPYVMADEFRVCLDSPGTVTIVDVSLEYSLGGLQVDAFGVRPHRDNYPTAIDRDWPTLWELGGFEEGKVEVDVACPGEDADWSVAHPHFDLGVQFSKPTDETARGANLLTTYVSGGKEHTLRQEFELILCRTDDDECTSWPLEEYEERT